MLVEGIEELFYKIEMPLIPVLAYMERNGARIDTASLKETSTLFAKRLAEIEGQIYSLAGESFNIASPKLKKRYFSSTAHFSAAFKKYAGISPIKYKK